MRANAALASTPVESNVPNVFGYSALFLRRCEPAIWTLTREILSRPFRSDTVVADVEQPGPTIPVTFLPECSTLLTKAMSAFELMLHPLSALISSTL